MSRTILSRHVVLSRLVAVGVLLGAVGAVASCTTDREEPSTLTTVSEGAASCACVPMGTCGTDPCRTVPSGSTLCLRCSVGREACMIGADGDFCGPTKLDSLVCNSGYCQMPSCSGCWLPSRILGGSPTCQTQPTVKQCGFKGYQCQSCVDGNECTSDVCEETKLLTGCINAATPSGTPACTVNAVSGFCTQGSCCVGCIDGSTGSCVSSTDATHCGGGGAACKVCDDGNPCTDDYCDAGGCVTKNKSDGTSCDNGTVCDGHETCLSGKCASAKPLVCDDGKPCTQNLCDALTGCNYPNNNVLPCSDGDPCTPTDVCTAGACVGTGTMVCNDGNPCTTDSCVKGKGCQFPAGSDGGTCDDGNGCTTNDKCSGGDCKGVGKSCDDGNDCTIDNCANDTCVTPHAPVTSGVQCDDGNPCTANTKCDGQGTCSGGQRISCSGGNPCVSDACVDGKGCPDTPVFNNGADCTDNNGCTVGDKCAAGVCVPGVATSCVPPVECWVGSCDPAKGGCVFQTAQDGSPCTNGSCKSGACQVATGSGGSTGSGGANAAGGAQGSLGGTVGSGGNSGGLGGTGGGSSGGAAGQAGDSFGGQDAAGTGAGGEGANSGSLGGTGNSAGSSGSISGTGAASGDSGASGTGASSPGGAPSLGGAAGSGLTAAGAGIGPQSGGRTSSTSGGAQNVDPSLVWNREPGGCSCRQSGSPEPSYSWAWGILALGLWRRRKHP